MKSAPTRSYIILTVVLPAKRGMERRREQAHFWPVGGVRKQSCIGQKGHRSKQVMAMMEVRIKAQTKVQLKLNMNIKLRVEVTMNLQVKIIMRLKVSLGVKVNMKLTAYVTTS